MKVKAKEQVQIAEILSEMGMSDEVIEAITTVKSISDHANKRK